jgi:hypothetical protein
MQTRFFTQGLSYLFKKSCKNPQQLLASSFLPLTKKIPKPLALLIGGGIATQVCFFQDTEKETKNTEEETVKDLPLNSITPLELLPAVYENMQPWTWPKGYPVPVEGLAYIKVQYWGFDNKSHVGALIVNKELAAEVLEIFCKLYENKFPIENMLPIHQFNNDDNLSMEANNTSAFNCRKVTDRPGEFSQHSYGRAIDINPVLNPYMKGNLILPKNAKKPHELKSDAPGKITFGSLPYLLFTQRGWDWGGGWKGEVIDKHHLEKRANGEKRNSNGYNP